MNAAGQICHAANYRPDRRNRRHGDAIEYGFRVQHCRFLAVIANAGATAAPTVLESE
jgi:hypothetical protein